MTWQNNHKQPNDVSYSPDGYPISTQSANPTHMQTGVVMSIDGDRYLLGPAGLRTQRYHGELHPDMPWL